MRMNGVGGVALAGVLGIGMAGCCTNGKTTRRLCGPQHRRHRPAADRDGSLCAVSLRHGACGPHHHAGNHGSLSCRQDLRISRRPCAADGLRWNGSDRSREDYASDFDHDFENATPYYYEADLQTWKIKR